ncbi:flagellar biosynthesis anti-sigma factor FlgM [Geotalea toluenoxydans]|uniref:flagellar biosynthesis anti-sigma factor FlgM n=1 Tax=Geotalea toluenoxydans TaxID=421624 RepID=UPI0006D15933|nr:flagellar biosynthesis anti-sigma factor FlgM [Geotalea toluenoxydans]
MKVDQQSQVHTIDFYHGRTAAADAVTGSGRQIDIIEISPAIREIDALKKSVATLPEMRLDRVALMKQQLGFGAYRIDAEFVAAKMIENHATGG